MNFVVNLIGSFLLLIGGFYMLMSSIIPQWIGNFNVIPMLILVLISLSLYWWTFMLYDTPIPSGSIYDTTESPYYQNYQNQNGGLFRSLHPNDFYFFPRIGVTNTSTNFASTDGRPLPSEVAEKCRLFGKDCIGFDSDGYMVLSRDKDALRFRLFSDGSDGYYRYIPESAGGVNMFVETCEQQFEGRASKPTKTCNMTQAQVDQLVRKLNSIKSGTR